MNISGDRMIGGSPVGGIPDDGIGGTPIGNLQSNRRNNSNGPPAAAQQPPGINPSVNGYGHTLVNPNAGGAGSMHMSPSVLNNQKNQMPVDVGGSRSILSGVSRNMNITENDMYVIIFVASVFYIGHNRILTKILSEKFGESSQYVALIMIGLITFISNRYFFIR